MLEDGEKSLDAPLSYSDTLPLVPSSIFTKDGPIPTPKIFDIGDTKWIPVRSIDAFDTARDLLSTLCLLRSQSCAVDRVLLSRAGLFKARLN